MTVRAEDVKREVLVDLGVHLEERLESATREGYQHKGASDALRRFAAEIRSGLLAACDKAFEEGQGASEGKSDVIPDLETLTIVKRWVVRAANAADNASAAERNHFLMFAGREAQLQDEHARALKELKALDAQIARKKSEREELEALVDSDPNLIREEDGTIVYLGDGPCPAGAILGNRAQRQVHIERTPVVKRRRRSKPRKAATKAS